MNERDTQTTIRIGPTGKQIDIKNTNSLLCKVIARVNRNHAERMDDIVEKLDALEIARLWDDAAKERENAK